MKHCVACRREIDGPDDVCRSCMAKISKEGSEPRTEEYLSAFGELVSLAQLTSVAEAGYFCDELCAAGVPCVVRQHDRFSGIHGHWQADYHLMAPAEFATLGAEMLHKLVSAQPPQQEAKNEATEAASGEVLHWHFPEKANPLGRWGLLTLAGLCAILMIGTIVYEAAPPKVAPEATNSLTERLARIAGPLTRPADQNQAGIRFRYDAERRLFYLEEDRDGDGRHEVVESFTTTGQPHE